MKKDLLIRLKFFPASIKSINSIQKYPHIIESYACILKIFAFMFLLLINTLISMLIWNMFYTKTIKISNIIIIKIKSNPISSNIRVLILIYYISPILYFSEISSRINTIKSRLTLIIFLYFKTS